MAWQSGSGYNQRSRIEAQVGRWKAIIGPKLKAAVSKISKRSAKIGVAILNKMTETDIYSADPCSNKSHSLYHG